MVSKQERSLTWKYFWQQKITEITLTLLIISAVIFIPYLLGNKIGDNMSTGCNGEFVEMVFEDVAFTSQNYWPSNRCNILDTWGEGLAYIFGFICGLALSIILIIAILGLIWKILSSWIISNWSKARIRAKTEVRNIKTKRTGDKNGN